MILALCEMQTASPRIWTLVALSISYDDDHCTMATSPPIIYLSIYLSISLSLYIYIYIYIYMFVCVCVCVCVREREGETERISNQIDQPTQTNKIKHSVQYLIYSWQVVSAPWTQTFPINHIKPSKVEWKVYEHVALTTEKLHWMTSCNLTLIKYQHRDPG